MPYIREPKVICPECGKAVISRLALRMHYIRWHTDAWDKATEVSKRAEAESRGKGVIILSQKSVKEVKTDGEGNKSPRWQDYWGIS